MDPLKLLTRTDRHFLGGGNRLLWAPPFPAHLDSPGFWDKAQYFNYDFQPVFTWTLLGGDGREIPLEFAGRNWNPAVLTQRYHAVSGRDRLTVTEEKCLLPGDVLACTIHVRSSGGVHSPLCLVAWTAQENFPSRQTSQIDDTKVVDGTLTFTKHLKHGDRPELRCGVAFGFARKTGSWSVNLSEGATVLPSWRLTPFYESFSRGKLPGDLKTTGVTDEGVLFMGIAEPVAPRPSSHLTILFAAAPSADEAAEALAHARKLPSAPEASVASWEEYFGRVPRFACSDEHLTRYYWYRWYGLRLNTISVIEGNYLRPFVCEGIGPFRAPITYSAMCHMRENRWMHTSALAEGSLLTFIDNQRDDGGFRGYIDVNHHRQEMFYHANWGDSVRELYAVHRSTEYLQSVYDGLKKYAAYFDRERDEEVSGLYDIDNHYETGQEFMHRYTAVDPNADRENWGEVFRLKGVDVTVYLYELKRALGFMAGVLGKADEAVLWSLEAEKIKTAVCEKMWDPQEEMFFDVDPATGSRTMAKAATCFYPYFTDIVEEGHLSGLKKHLLNPREFWTPYPVPSSAASDEMFRALPEWKGKRMNCPWNGRVWPMTNSHIAEALATPAIRFNDPLLKRKAVEFITTFIGMMFFDGDPKRPNCFEHYNPLSGRPSLYRGVDDYQHSWVVDLLMKYVCGIRPTPTGILVDPFPFGLRHVVADNVFAAGRNLKVEIRKSRITVTLDGRKRINSVIGQPVFIRSDDHAAA